MQLRIFFENGHMLKEINSTTIALVPKVPIPTSVRDSRPISCYTTLCKCIAKILANRIKVVQLEFVSFVHNAFILGRRLVDNVLLAQELLRNYHRNSGIPRCTLKADIWKAYDTFNWNFLFWALEKFGFPDKVVGWIRESVTTIGFFVLINGELKGFFTGARGI